MDIIVTNVALGWNDDLSEEDFTVDFQFDLKGDTYVGQYVYCTGNEYESVRCVEVTLDGVPQYFSGEYDEVTHEFVEFTGTYLSRAVPEDYWHEEFIYAVLNPIWEAREKATAAAMAEAKDMRITCEEELA